MLDRDEQVITTGDRSWSEQEPTRHAAEVQALLQDLPPVDAVGHRVVYGGSAFHQAVLIDGTVHAAIAELAPLHNPAALAGIDAVTAIDGVPAAALHV